MIASASIYTRAPDAQTIMPGIFMRLRRLQKERILKNYVKLFVKMLTPLHSRYTRVK